MTAAPAVAPAAPLVLRGVRHSYGEAEVLHGIDLTLRGGEAVALLGPSGSGKTTLLAVAGGLLRPTSGEVTVLGTPLTGRRDEAARRVAYVLQAGSLIPYLTVEENLLVRRVVTGRRPTPADRAEARCLLEAVDLAAKAGRYPDRLSGGERQRACVAQALFTRAPVLLADEPTASLDRARGRAVTELLTAHARDTGAAVLLATHDERALDLTDRTVSIEDGLLRDGY
ncbi:ABC transporter ATP-binding protein [Actinomadura kijaniata]|uniref:ABC transporter ATP-binding protein n=1 Tax=Actinomadura kijaniata TaxID=46161 RepID=UPI0008299A56|nr:ATP-binding cassette domain-containing protein [Actinomadura kijaniata]